MKSYYPFDQFRPGTEEAMDKIESAFNSGKRFVRVEAPTGCHGPGTKVLMFDGSFKNIEDVVVGDLLVGEDSLPRKVQKLYSGEDEMFEVIANDTGFKFTVNKDHYLVCRDGIGEEDYELLVSQLVTMPSSDQADLLQYRTAINLSNDDYPDVTSLVLKSKVDYQLLKSSFNSRLEFLSLLANNFGFKNRDQTLSLKLNSRKFADFVTDISNSLGYVTTRASSYIVGIDGELERLDCKKAKFSNGLEPEAYLHYDFTVNYIGRGKYYGVNVDSDSRYLLKDMTVTRNSGKSGLAVAFSRKYRTTIWTPTKILQEQYANTDNFKFEYTVKGKSNYYCGLPGQSSVKVSEAICCSNNVTMDNEGIVPFPFNPDPKKASSMLKKKCAESGICPYYAKLSMLKTKPGGILNYDLGLRVKTTPKGFGYDLGDAVVLDEAHQIISKATSIFGYKLTNTGAMKLLGQAGKRLKDESPEDWLQRLFQTAVLRQKTEKDPKKISRLDIFAGRINGIIEMDIRDEKRFFIEDKKAEVEIKPLDLRYFKSALFYPFKKILMLSATFPSNFSQVLGIKPEEEEIIKIPSTFPKKNRKTIFAHNITNMNKNTILSKEADQFKVLNHILAAHKNDKGIIHCGNYKFFDQLHALYKNNKRFIWVSQDKDKDLMLESHEMSPNPTILVSPALLEGVDLKDDLGRFGVLLKVPYPPYDEYNKRMGKIFYKWYENLTITNIVQAYGRTVRHQDDYANFYILDGAFRMLVQRNKDLIPQYFAESLKIGDMSKLVNILIKKAND